MDEKEKRRLYMRDYREIKAGKERKGRKEGRRSKGKVIEDGFNIDKKGVLGKGELAEIEKEDGGERDNEKSAIEMLQDMRWVYRQSGGRSKLKRLIKGDDKQFVFMVKELMKIEAALLAARIRKDGGGEGGGGRQNFFVILKGLEDDKVIMDSFNSKLDMKQIESATNPDTEKYIPDEEVNQRDAPEAIEKKLTTD